ncbi:hypothetical protein F4778DRAFT_737443 [Xylariomycetidae sp. FL2044]|nr:hypothetical protein F4778DRAFT_737443 [Xylariomycetidae sp. FL2044]
MPYTLYDGTVPVVQGMLRSLDHFLTLAEAHPSSATLLHSTRLREDMYPLADQVRLATQWPMNALARLLTDQQQQDPSQPQQPPPALGPSPQTWQECHDRIATVLAACEAADRDEVNKGGERTEPTKLGPAGERDMSGAEYFHVVILPNFYFHVATAYGILRSAGVGLGKGDWYEGFGLGK